MAVCIHLRIRACASRRLFGIAALVCGLALAPPSGQAKESSLGTFKSWSAMRFNEKGKRACMLWSQPRKSEGDYKKRGEVFVFVTLRPVESRHPKVSVESGYTFKTSSEVALTIKARAFMLPTDGSTAWVRADQDNEALVKAMRGGREMIVEGTSSRGTETRDAYSLYGFSAAHDAITKACKR